MREILFRAKRIDNGEWVEGYLIQSPYMGEVRSWISTPEDKTRLRAIATYYGDWRAVEVLTETICQYTGLTDKNGNKIWENDVVEIPGEGDCFKVMWSDTEARYEMQSDSLVVDFDNYWSYEVEVIGNTFDNACIDELLKGEEG